MWKGTCDGLEVAVKVLKLYECNDQEEIRKVSGRPYHMCPFGLL